MPSPPDITIDWTDVAAIAPELATGVPPVGITVGQQSIILAQVQDEMSLADWGTQERVDRAATWYAAHLGTGFRLGQFGPALTNVTTGQVTKGFKQRQDKAWPLDQTGYGRQFQAMALKYLPRFALT